MLAGMKLVASLKLLPSPQQAKSLRLTLTRCNEAATWLARFGQDAETFGRYALHKLAYADLRIRFGLTAQATIRTIAKVADAYKVRRETAPVFRPNAAQAYDDRILRFVRNGDAVSLWTLDGRIVVPVAMGEHQRRLMAHRKGESDLCFVRGCWHLAITCDVPEATTLQAEDWLGVDLGLMSLAVDSDGTMHTGADVERVRQRLAKRKAGLQRRRTKAAKRKLRKLAGKEARFRAHTNHCISKAVVQKAQRTARGIALEDLRGIRARVTAPRRQRARLHSWGFAQLRSFLSYKARRTGVPLACVNPSNTSRACPACGCVDKRNRPDQATFRCIGCGHTAPADQNAAVNIRARALAAQGEVMTPGVPAA